MGKVVDTCWRIIDVVTDVDLSYGFSLLATGSESFFIDCGTTAYLKVIESVYVTDFNFYYNKGLCLVLIGGS